MAGAAVLRISTVAAKQRHPKWIYKAPVLGGGHPAARGEELAPREAVNTPVHSLLRVSEGEQLSGISVEDTAVSQTVT